MVQQSNNDTGLRGVYRQSAGKSWYAKITIDGVNNYLGSFGTPGAAHAAYLKAAAVKSSPEELVDQRNAEMLFAVKALYSKDGPSALAVPSLRDAGLYTRLRNYGLTQSVLLKELDAAEEYANWRSQHRSYRGKTKPTWTWEIAIAEAKRLVEEQGDLPTLEWCRRNGHSTLGNVVFQSGHTWEELRGAVGSFGTAPYRQSRNGIRWRSQPECSFSNFLYARGIEHKRGERYANRNAEHTGHHSYDVHFRTPSGDWVDVEIWGDLPAFMAGGKYSATRTRKENWRKGDMAFLGVQYRDCLSDAQLSKILRPYIGEIEPFVFDKPTDQLIQTAFWSDADELLEHCRRFAATMPDGIFPNEGWLRKRGKYSERDGVSYNTLAVRVNQWLGGIRNLRKILGQGHAGTIDWNPAKVVEAWQEFAERNGVTPSQAKGGKIRARLSHQVFLEANRIYDTARRLGVLDAARQGKTAHKIKWTREFTIQSWMDFVAAHGRTPTQCMSAAQRKSMPKEVTDLAANIYGAARRHDLLLMLRA